MARIVKQPGERQKEIIDVAIKLFKKNGVACTSVHDIVKEVGVAQGTFYWHFKSKQDLINTIVGALALQNCRKMAEISKNKKLDAYQKLTKIRDAVFSDIVLTEEAVQQFHHPSNKDIHDQLILEITRVMIPILEKVIKQGVKEKIFNVKDSKKAATFIFGATTIINEASFDDIKNKNKWKSAISEFAFRGLGYQGENK
ncbi:MAG: TetR/AcrR family transcriptional regulator [Actinobacteria bacterium]|nr:MAG: TetR/AcrR family transcriptional regulator [Actinomycetota bacterium]